MKIFQVQINIDASKESIWKILSHTDQYPEWDPLGEEVKIKVVNQSRWRFFKRFNPSQLLSLKLTQAEYEKKMIFSRTLPLGLARGVRQVTLCPKGCQGFSIFIKETFSGPLVHMFGQKLPDITDSFELLAQGLKRRAELLG